MSAKNRKSLKHIKFTLIHRDTLEVLVTLPVEQVPDWFRLRKLGLVGVNDDGYLVAHMD